MYSDITTCFPQCQEIVNPSEHRVSQGLRVVRPSFPKVPVSRTPLSTGFHDSQGVTHPSDLGIPRVRLTTDLPGSLVVDVRDYH